MFLEVWLARHTQTYTDTHTYIHTMKKKSTRSRVIKWRNRDVLEQKRMHANRFFFTRINLVFLITTNTQTISKKQKEGKII